MDVWAVIAQKGGSGKTTLSTNLAIEALRTRLKTIIIDVDAQKSATHWGQRRLEKHAENQLPVWTMKPAQVAKQLLRAEGENFDLVLIDTAGSLSTAQANLLTSVNFAIVPCQPSILDIETVSTTVDLLNSHGVSYAITLTRVPALGQDEAMARTELNKLGTVAKPFTGERKAYKGAFAAGEGVSEFRKDEKAAFESYALFKWLKRRANRT